MTKGKFRLFFAIELSPAVQTQLLEFQSSIELEQAKPVPAENFHITLSFLGDTNEKKLEAIIDNFVSPEISPFILTTQDLVYWPKPKVACLSVGDPKNHLVNCKQQIEKQLNSIGLRHFDKKR
ncbi:MAG: RNA 2',3'-cyclic phosphodiesterase, partial [Kangiellaceae bacterium]|nr:RNA 2',3'-cyclic phosphodiesterase [Kangiellaceae bacterium]